jgi:hypothetical protein
MTYFSFYLFSFSFYKIQEQEDRTDFGEWGGVGTSGRRKGAGKEGRRMNTMQKMYIHVGKCKNNNS